jgi:hypothetical protein
MVAIYNMINKITAYAFIPIKISNIVHTHYSKATTGNPQKQNIRNKRHYNRRKEKKITVQQNSLPQPVHLKVAKTCSEIVSDKGTEKDMALRRRKALHSQDYIAFYPRE